MAASVDRLGIVGTGTMGAGIAQVAAQAGCEVWLVDVMPGAVDLAVDRIARGLTRAVERGTLTEDARGAALARLHRAPDLAALADVEFVVEAVIEREPAKVDVLAALDGVVGADTIVASNTSSISITRLAAATRRPGRVVGMHFF